MTLLLAPPNYRRDDCLETPLRWVYQPHSEAALNALARDILENRVFHSGMINSPRDISMVFMPLMMIDARTLRRLRWHGVGLFYEYWDRAGPRSVNGYPCFMSFRWLDKSDAQRLGAKVAKLEAALRAALED